MGVGRTLTQNCELRCQEFDTPQNLTEQLTQSAMFLLTDSPWFRRRFLSVLEGPKETRTRQPQLSQRLMDLEKESIVTKRVPFGDPAQTLQNQSTRRLTQTAESRRNQRRS